MLLGFLEGLGLGVSEEEGERGRFDIGFAKWWGWSLMVEKLLVLALLVAKEEIGGISIGGVSEVLKTFLS